VLLKTDQLIEHRHFVSGTSLDLVGRKAIARAISDIAAMAGTPVATLAACALPHGFAQERANELFEACSRWARVFGAPLVGGDIATFVAADAPVTLTITSVGLPHASLGAVLRSGAKAGDHLYITGAIGGSFEKATGMGRHLTFEPRVAEGRWLANVLGAALHAMMDVSDGVGIDAARMAEASGVEVELDVPREVLSGDLLPRAEIPQSRDFGQLRELVLRAVSDGEDYELLFAVDPGVAVPAVCPGTGTAITRIGVCVAGKPGAYLRFGDERIDVSKRGWEHQ
jgi:thiamine-monophosphate kinase